jgi:peptide/nickel transport system substrate-binding protein
VQNSPKEALTALGKGQVDLVTSLIPKDTLKIAKSSYSKVVKGRKDVRYTIGFLNLRSPTTRPLRDIRVRKALNYAVNKEELLRYAFKGNGDKMRGVLTVKSDVDLSDAEPYDFNITQARALMKEAGYEEGFGLRLFYQEKDYLTAYLLKRFFSLLKVDAEINPVNWEWIVKHAVYPNTREGYSWEKEDWWIVISSHPAYVPELASGILEWWFHIGAPWQMCPDGLVEPLHTLRNQVHRTKDPQKRFQIYKKANDYIANQALLIFAVAPLSLYGINEEVEFIPHPSQYLYLDHSSVTDSHWSVQGKNN